tara:strand:+ start:112 stop:564 length:453 start_codon:yes stop_codon:yes gene_type:complete
MKTSWHIKSVSKKRAQVLRATFDDQNQELEIIDAETGSKLVFFIEDLKNFKKQIDQIVNLIEKISAKSSSYSGSASEYLKKVREKFPNAYKPWPDNDDKKLKKMFMDGKKIPELAKYFQRRNGAIRARLKKLGLIKDSDPDIDESVLIID